MPITNDQRIILRHHVRKLDRLLDEWREVARYSAETGASFNSPENRYLRAVGAAVKQIACDLVGDM